MKVWIDQEQCTSSGLCEVISPEVFQIEDDALAHLRSGDVSAGRRVYTVPAGLCDQVQEAAGQCPGECIYIEES
ncbi:MAG: ferredoxin [Actinomycetota bacterium]|nr:ferredoxin [Actinomycetota bacterium]